MNYNRGHHHQQQEPRQHQIAILIEKCRDSRDVDSRFALLKEINAFLPPSDRIKMPSLVTNDYCHKALEIIEYKVAQSLKILGREFNWP